jgi:hypothetical protein
MLRSPTTLHADEQKARTNHAHAKPTNAPQAEKVRTQRRRENLLE